MSHQRLFHRFDPETCLPARRRRKLAAALLAGFAAGALGVSLAAGPIRALGGSVATLASRAGAAPAGSQEWREARLAVAPEAFVRQRSR